MAATRNGQEHHQHDDIKIKPIIANDTPSAEPDDNRDGNKSPTMFSYVQRYIDRLVSPQLRRQAYDSISQFAIARPILFFFIATQLFFSTLPLLAFLAFVICAIIFSLIGALITTLFLIGFALMFLLPTIFLTSFIAILAWTWIAGTFLIARWLYPHAFVSAPPAAAAAAAQWEGGSGNENGIAVVAETKKSGAIEVKRPESNGDYVIDPDY